MHDYFKPYQCFYGAWTTDIHRLITGRFCCYQRRPYDIDQPIVVFGFVVIVVFVVVFTFLARCVVTTLENGIFNFSKLVLKLNLLFYAYWVFLSCAKAKLLPRTHFPIFWWRSVKSNTEVMCPVHHGRVHWNYHKKLMLNQSVNGDWNNSLQQQTPKVRGIKMADNGNAASDS